ncbi:hypothetical protein Tco_1434503 [Tanacetum coccineum]
MGNSGQSFFIFENFAFDIIYIDMFDETWTQEKLFMNARALIEGLGSMDAMNFTDTMYGNIRASKVVVVWKGTNHKKLKMWIHGSGLKLKNKKDDFQDLGEVLDFIIHYTTTLSKSKDTMANKITNTVTTSHAGASRGNASGSHRGHSSGSAHGAGSSLSSHRGHGSGSAHGAGSSSGSHRGHGRQV